MSKTRLCDLRGCQIAAGVSGSSVVAAVDTNRLTEFRDFNVDAGGFVKRDKVWWYGA